MGVCVWHVSVLAAACPAPQGGPEGFMAMMQPIIQAENHKIAQSRAQLQHWRQQLDLGQPLTIDARMALAKLSGVYQVTFTHNTRAVIAALLVRVDTVPMGLALAQAANESAWGTSRFAQQGCNYFGQWCHRPGCGLVPQQRAPNATHEVRRFKTAADSVAAYMRNLNRNPAYQDFRQQRLALRRAKAPLTGQALVHTMAPYTRQNPEYGRILAHMLARHHMDQRG